MDEAIKIALEVTRGDRQRDYAHPLLNMVRIAVRQTLTHRDELKDGKAINPYKAVLAMVDVKLAREEATPKQDNIVDSIGYTDMIDRMAQKLIELGYCTNYVAARQYFDNCSFVDLIVFHADLEKAFLREERNALLESGLKNG